MTPDDYRRHQQARQLVVSTERLMTTLFEAVCSIRGAAKPVVIRQRLDQADAAQRDFVKAMTTIERENKPRKPKGK